MFAARTAILRSPFRKLTAQEIAANTSQPPGNDSLFNTVFPMLRLASIPAIGFAMNTMWPQERKTTEKWFC